MSLCTPDNSAKQNVSIIIMMMSQYSGAMASMASTITEAAQAHTPINDSDREILPQPWLSFVCLLIPLAILTAVGGNLLIMLSYKRDALLRNVHNLYLLHLAVCDFCIGSFSMSFYFIYTGEFVSLLFEPSAYCSV